MSAPARVLGTVKAAAILVNRDVSRIYRWIDHPDGISSWIARDGTIARDETGETVPVPERTILVDLGEVLEYEKRMKLRKNNTRHAS